MLKLNTGFCQVLLYFWFNLYCQVIFPLQFNILDYEFCFHCNKLLERFGLGVLMTCEN